MAAEGQHRLRRSEPSEAGLNRPEHDVGGAVFNIVTPARPVVHRAEVAGQDATVASQTEFGRPGRKADLARELHQAFADRGIDLLPGRARKMLDERVAAVAAQMRVSDKAALRYLPPDWPEQTAADVALEREQVQIAEQMATGTVTISAARLSALMAGLAVAVQNSVWPVLDGSLPASVGEPLDSLTALALTLHSVPADVEVGRAELLAVARHLGGEADVLRAGGSSPEHDDAAQLDRVVDRLAGDAELARRMVR